ncbi:hypothetical protein GCM10023258_13490 [Terrabacter aeriphilus]|uniref:Heparinase II/III-like C-terminal domain-containing protein n=1 Tax=Terrabacter aeriphilus TaxID=515662 RepID=A0ABP9J8W0_9MICO
MSSRADASRALLARLAPEVAARLPAGSGAAGVARARRLLADDELDVAEHGVVTDMVAAWDDQEQRSRARLLHGFLFLADVRLFLETASPTDRAAMADKIIVLLKEWDRRFPLGGTANPMAYHDETTAQRVTQLLSILPQLSEIVPTETGWLRDLLDRTADLLASDDFHAGSNNHGMFQDIALLSYAALGTWRDLEDRERYFRTADERLMGYFRVSFTSEGVHVENAPNYHVLVARHLKEHRDLLAAVGSDHADELDALLQGATVYATHAVMPTGAFPLISDTQPTHLPTVARQVFRDAGFLYAATSGAQGSMPSSRVLVLPRSGYAIYRSAWGDPDATFVLFHAAYRSGYHKHSDDNSIWIRHGGRDLLREAGPNGYQYAHPLTQYAYSQYAHNTAIVAGRSTPRHDGRFDDVSMRADDVRGDGFRATGRNARLAGAVHERAVSVTEDPTGHPTIEVDDVITCDESKFIEILWNVGEGLDVRLGEGGFDLVAAGRRVMSLSFTSDVDLHLSVHAGQQTPRYLGWRFPKFGAGEPSPVVRMLMSGARAHVTSTIRFHDEAVGLPGAAAQPRTEARGSFLTVELNQEATGGVIDAVARVPGAQHYAFRLYRGKDVVGRLPYAARSAVRWDALPPGRYRVRVFARTTTDDAITAETSASLHVR